MTEPMTKGRYVQHLLSGDMIKDEATAVELASVLIRRNCGEEALKAQRRLSGHQDGDYWWVEGAPKGTPDAASVPPVYIKLEKTGGAVASFFFNIAGLPSPMATPKEADAADATPLM